MFGWDELFLCRFRVVVYGSGERGERGGDLACDGPSESQYYVFVEHWNHRPCKAGDDVAGASAKASKSRRTEDDCLRAELKRVFYMGQQNHYRQFKRHTNHYGEEQEEAEAVGEMEVAFDSPKKMLLLYVARLTVIYRRPWRSLHAASERLRRSL